MDMLGVPQRGAAIWDETRLRRPRLRAAVRLHPPGRRGRAAGPGHRLVRLGVLLRRPLPRAVQAQPGPGRRPGLPGRAARVHAGRRADRRSRPTRWRPGWPTCGSARCRPLGGLAGPLRREHPQPARRVAVGTGQHHRGPGVRPGRLHRDAPQGRRGALVGEPGRARRDAEVPAVIAAPGRCRCCGTPSPTPCTCATTCSPTSARSTTRASSPTACWCLSGSWAATPRRPPTGSTSCSPPGCSSSSTPR